MAGNVWEWMGNLHGDDEPWGSVRGGSFYTSDLHCTEYQLYKPVYRGIGIGFRVVRSQS
jgi:formylglycine-generating enzyme required for sulfatase activity